MSKEKNTPVVVVRLSDDMKNRVRASASEQYCSESDVVRRLILERLPRVASAAS
jgi:hypothetical protein